MSGPMNGANVSRGLMNKPRARKEAARVLAIALQTRHRRLLEASGEADIVQATADLAQCMYENIEFILWALKSQAGMNPPPPEELKSVSKSAATARLPANDDPMFAKPPTFLAAECTCPPLEPGIIGRDKHMTACPLFQP